MNRIHFCRLPNAARLTEGDLWTCPTCNKIYVVQTADGENMWVPYAPMWLKRKLDLKK